MKKSGIENTIQIYNKNVAIYGLATLVKILFY